MTDYWIANYFRQPDYLAIDGKPVVIVFTPRELRRDMGTDAVRTAFARMRERARAAGLPGIYIMGAARENTRLEALVHEGCDAGTGYNYPRAGMSDDTALSAPYSAMVDGYEQI
jgi:Glycosyltransferase WbsX